MFKLVSTSMVGRARERRVPLCTTADKIFSHCLAGPEPDLLSARDLHDAGVQSFGSEEDKEKGPPNVTASQIESFLSKINNDEGGSNSQPPLPLVSIGTGLPALPRKLIARVLANEYVDFAELPPAKGKGKPLPVIGRSDHCCSSGRTDASEEGHTRHSHMDAVLRHLCCKTVVQVSSENSRIDGLPNNNSKSQPALPVAKLGGV